MPPKGRPRKTESASASKDEQESDDLFEIAGKIRATPASISKTRPVRCGVCGNLGHQYVTCALYLKQQQEKESSAAELAALHDEQQLRPQASSPAASSSRTYPSSYGNLSVASHLSAPSPSGTRPISPNSDISWQFDDHKMNSSNESLIGHLSHFQEEFQLRIKCSISIPAQDGSKDLMKNRWAPFEHSIDIVPEQLSALVSLLTTPAKAALQKNIINTGKKISSALKAKKAKKDAELAALKANFEQLQEGIRDTSAASESYEMHGGGADLSDLNI